MGKKRKTVTVVLILILLIGVALGLYFSRSEKNFYIEDAGISGNSFLINQEKGFDANSVLLKMTVKQGESFSKNLKVITNTKSVRTNFKVNVNEMDFVFVEDSDFFLEPDETKTLKIDFDIKNQEPGIYIGEILILNGGTVLTIPVILEIETKEVLFDSIISVPAEYSNIHPGEKAVIENKMFNLENIGMESVEVNYFVKDFKGKTIFSEQENLVIESQLFTNKVFPIPDDVEAGNYVFMIITRHGSSVGTSSYFFKISPKGYFNEMNNNFFMWIVIFLLFGLIFFIIYYVRQRDKMYMELGRQYRNELGKEVVRLKREEKQIKQIKPAKRKIVLKNFKNKSKKRLKAIKQIYKSRVEEIKKLKKQKKKSEMEEKLEQWKKQGYNVDEFLIKTGREKQNLKEIGGEIKSYKKQGYKL